MNKRLTAHSLVLTFAALVPLLATVPTQSEGVPLPGITLYGTITDQAGTARLTSGLLQVQLTPQGGEAITLLVPLMNLGGQFSYVLRVPVELDVAGETLSNNAVPVPQTSVTYAVSANLGGVALSLLGGTTSFPFSPDEHRGSVHRIDMQATGFVTIAEDANEDGEVTRDDLLFWFEHWMDTIPAKFDFDGNGRIDSPDLVHLLDTIREASAQ